jgi:histidinol phosphatase-like enzyme (inositol monophosphatase family)
MDLLAAKDTALSYIKPVSKEIMKWFRTDFKVHEKSDNSPVTIADRNAEQILRKKIAADFPGCGIIGEEFGNEKPTAEWVWTIDPIDGTRSFIRGIPLFATLLSLLHHGEPVVGIIALPALGETAWAVKGKGAFCGNRRLRVSQNEELSSAVISTADYYCFKTKKCLRLLNQLNSKTAINRTYPDAFGHLLAIQGSIDVMVDPWAYIWDFAPCKILAEEAGGAFANFTGKKGSITEGTAIVGNSQLVKKVQELYRNK